MSLHLDRSLGWQVVLGLTMLGGICALTAMLYLFQARQHLGSNYTTLAVQVVRPQSHAVLLRHTLHALRERPRDIVLNERLNNLLWRIPKHIDVVSFSLRASELRRESYASPVDCLDDVKKALLELQLASQPNSGVSHNERLELGFMIENDLAKAYSELSDLVHSEAGKQRIIMGRLALTIALLVFVILLLVVGLSFALRKLNIEHQKVTQLSLVDELTGLGNRRYLLNFTDSLFQQSQRSGRPLSLVLLDIDHFKQVNDRFGHPAGDDVLKVFAQALTAECRNADIVARLGGEEFCVLMPDADADGARELAERVRIKVAGLTQQQLGISISITVSLGVATACQSGLDFKHLYARADQALYQAKSKGRNRVEKG